MKLPIKAKRDWIITIFILFVVLYYSTMYFNTEIEEFMMRFSPDKLNIMNYPGGWGNFLVVGLLMTLIMVAMMAITKVKVKRIAFVASIGIVFTCIMFFGFILHTNLIVGSSKTMEATSIRISCFDVDINVDATRDTDLATQFIAAAVSMKAKDANEQKKLRAERDLDGKTAYHIWISYPEKYGQSYDLILYVDGNKIYSNHGMGTPNSRLFYEDNGFYELLQRLVEGSQDDSKNRDPS